MAMGIRSVNQPSCHLIRSGKFTIPTELVSCRVDKFNFFGECFQLHKTFDKRTFLGKIPINYYDATVSLFDSVINI